MRSLLILPVAVAVLGCSDEGKAPFTDPTLFGSGNRWALPGDHHPVAIALGLLDVDLVGLVVQQQRV